MQGFWSAFGRFTLWTGTYLLLCFYAATAQYNASFDSAYQSAEALPDARTRLGRLTKLVDQSYEGSPFQTISFGKILLQTAKEAGGDTDRYAAHITLSTGYARAGNYSEAIDNGLKAVAIARKRKDYPRQIRALQSVAFTYGTMGLVSGDTTDQQKGLRQCEEAMQLVKTHGIAEEEAYTLTVAADLHAMFGEYDTAIGLYRQAIAAHQKQRQNVPLPLYLNLGNTLDLAKDYSGSFAAYKSADSINEKSGNSPFYAIKIASNRAILYNDRGNPEESEREALAVLGKARKMGATDVEVDMLAHLQKLYRSQGRFAQALSFGDSLAAVKERMLNADKAGQVAEMQARYDAGVKDQQIAGQQVTIRQKGKLNTLLWTGIALLFLLGCAAFIGLTRSRRLNRLLNEQRQLLAHQKEALQKANEAKDQLFTLLSHDMRVPLNSLIAYATLLDQQGDLPPEKIKKYNANLRQALSDTTVLMENLLQFVKTQMQALRPYPEAIPLTEVLARVIRLLQPALDQKGLRLETDFDPSATALADEDMTEVILRNLLSNAIKFSNAGQQITLSVKTADDQTVCCTVSDTGTGMSPELATQWNDAAHQQIAVRSRPGTQHEKGAGLGMMLCKTFTRAMNGQLAVESREEKGTVCTLCLPQVI